MQTYQKRQTKQALSTDKPAASQAHGMMSNQLVLKTMGNDEDRMASHDLLDTLRSRFDVSGEEDRKAFNTLQNVNADQGRRMEMEDGLRGRLESMTGYDLSRIKIRESRQPADMGAKAFAKGNVIHFAPGQYRPDSENGQHMIAHEVAHVVQQARGGIRPDSHMLNVNTDSALESSADRMGSRLVSGEGGYAPAQGLAPLPSMDVAAAPVQGLFGGIGKKLKNFASSVGSAISSGIGSVGGAIASGAKSAWSGAKTLAGKVGSGLSTLGGKIADGASYVGGAIASGASKAWNGAKNMASAAATKIGDGAGWLGGKIASGASKAWNFAKEKGGQIKRWHQRSVDELNNNREEYDKLSKWKRFKWTMMNPLARIHANFDKEGTEKRNAHEADINKAAEELAATRHQDEADTLTDEEMTYATGGNARGSYLPIDGNSKISKLGKASSIVGGVAAAAPAAVKAGDGVVGDLSSLKAPADGIGIAGGALGALGGGIGAIKSGSRAVGQFKDGNYAGGAASVLDTVSNLGSIGGGVSRIVGNAAGGAVAKTALEQVVPGMSIATGGAQALSGAIRFKSANDTRKAMNKRLEEFAPKDGSTADRDTTYDPNMTKKEKLLRMAQRTSKIRMTEAGFDMGSGALKAAGGAASFAPVPGLGAGLGLAGAVGDLAKFGVSKYMMSNHKQDTLNREFNLDGEIEEYMKNHEGIDKRDAKHIILKSRGFKSGHRAEAFAQTASKKAISLHQQASKDGPEGEEARGILKDMGLHNTGNKLSIQAIAEKLGMEEGADWQKQVKKLGNTGPSWR